MKEVNLVGSKIRLGRRDRIEFKKVSGGKSIFDALRGEVLLDGAGKPIKVLEDVPTGKKDEEGNVITKKVSQWARTGEPDEELLCIFVHFFVQQQFPQVTLDQVIDSYSDEALIDLATQIANELQAQGEDLGA